MRPYVMVAADEAARQRVERILEKKAESGKIRLGFASCAGEMADRFREEAPAVLILYPEQLRRPALESIRMLAGRGTKIIAVSSGTGTHMRETYGCPVSRFIAQDEEGELARLVEGLIRCRKAAEERNGIEAACGSSEYHRILVILTEEPLFVAGARECGELLAGEEVPARIVIVGDIKCVLEVRASSLRELRRVLHCVVRYLFAHGAHYRIGVSGPLRRDGDLYSMMQCTEDMLIRREVTEDPEEPQRQRIFYADEYTGKKNRSKHVAVQAACTYIDRNYAKPLRVGDVASAVYVSKNYLSTVFREDMGTSLQNYLDKIRLHKARNDLLAGGRPIKMIAKQNGFCNSSYFSKRFTEEYGLSPRAYHKEYQRKMLERIRELEKN